MSMESYAEVARNAAFQWGLFTSAQARSVGATAQQMSSWARRGLVDRVAHGVYRIVGAPDDDRLDGLRVAWLATAPELWAAERTAPAVVSHLSAAHSVYGLGTASPDKDHLTVADERRTRAAHVRLHVDPTLAAEDWEFIDGLPVTTLPRTVADLYASSVDGGHLGDVIRDGLRGGAAAHDLAAALDRVSGGRGRWVLEESLATCGAPRSLAAASDLLSL